MSDDGSHQISTRIDQKLAALKEKRNEGKNQFIFRIHQILRRENEKAYEPELLAIGPYHHGKDNFQKMEKYKLQYLEGLLERRGESSAERYISALVEVEEDTRSYYADDISLSSDDFVEMMLLDGSFIIEFLRKYNRDKEEAKNDPIFSMKWLVEILCRDLLLFENQLPFSVLVKLFHMTKLRDEEDQNLYRLAISCLNHCIAADNAPEYNTSQNENVFHLLSLVYESWCSPFLDAHVEEELPNSSSDQRRCDFSVIVTFFQKFIDDRSQQTENQEGLQFIKSVCELEKDGIKFRKANRSKSWLHIEFKNGVMEIPTLVVRDVTESLLKNLIGYEFHQVNYVQKVVTDYTTFMDCLINSSEDVKTLRHQKIIENWLGNDEELSNMFNKIGKNVCLLPPSFSYSNIFKQVNDHCSKRCHQWIAELKRNYFNNPWSIFAFLAATLLLLLTLIQTIFSLFQYVKDTKVVCNCK